MEEYKTQQKSLYSVMCAPNLQHILAHCGWAEVNLCLCCSMLGIVVPHRDVHMVQQVLLPFKYNNNWLRNWLSYM